MTFERIIVDVKRAFANGQAYVAFSRCKSLDGLILKSRVHKYLFKVNEEANKYLVDKIANIETLAEHIHFYPFQYKDSITIEDEAQPNLAIVKKLKKWRLDLANQLEIPPYFILGDKTINNISITKPLSMESLLEVKGIGPHKATTYGTQIIDVVKSVNGEENENFPSTKKNKKISHKVSYEMYRNGKSIDEIATECGLTVNTIYTHLIKYVEIGELKAEDIISGQEISLVTKYLETHPNFIKLREIYEGLAETVSYNSIKIVLASLKNK